MSLAKTAIAFFSRFNIKILRKVFSEMVYGNLPELEGDKKYRLFLMSKEKILLVPTNLRHNVWKQWKSGKKFASGCMICVTFLDWILQNFFFWRSDGTIDRAKRRKTLCQIKL
ncbi:hypothetical protein AVEN_188278-1 [Araneus ventricosus]|uniref:Uncharacterized protein n=1 Tax=Araneus ventricosus TaxID=182803 RepID=A0A4Y2S4D6_ARAVE|nr:hypothetical protein AVEN_188278-1 [Araneus ventricosus]